MYIVERDREIEAPGSSSFSMYLSSEIHMPTSHIFSGPVVVYTLWRDEYEHRQHMTILGSIHRVFSTSFVFFLQVHQCKG